METATEDAGKPPVGLQPDVVGLHQLVRGPHAPNMSPFALKLETYLRMAKIPYQSDQDQPFSSKGKTPWITYNGEDVADSQFCIEFLNDKFNVDLSRHLSDEQKAIAHAFQKLVDESNNWCLMRWRWEFDEDDALRNAAFDAATIAHLRPAITNQAHGQGMGRHTKEEVYHIAELDLKALSMFMGNKAFLMGDESSEVDAAIFGMLAQWMWNAPGSPPQDLMMKKYTNLSGYCERMKERFWPDWEECITRGGTQKATK